MNDQQPSEEAVAFASKYVFPYDSAGEYGLDTVVFFDRSMFLQDETPEGVERAAIQIREAVAHAFDAFAADAIKRHEQSEFNQERAEMKKRMEAVRKRIDRTRRATHDSRKADSAGQSRAHRQADTQGRRVAKSMKGDGDG